MVFKNVDKGLSLFHGYIILCNYLLEQISDRELRVVKLVWSLNCVLLQLQEELICCCLLWFIVLRLLLQSLLLSFKSFMLFIFLVLDFSDFPSDHGLHEWFEVLYVSQSIFKLLSSRSWKYCTKITVHRVQLVDVESLISWIESFKSAF